MLLSFETFDLNLLSVVNAFSKVKSAKYCFLRNLVEQFFMEFQYPGEIFLCKDPVKNGLQL